MQDKVSVIVPVYRVENYLKTCLDSLVAQSYKNLEIILVDDGSPDGCPQICDQYGQRDSRIQVIHRKNGGLAAARNTGIKMASGAYLVFVDSDDWVDPYYVENLYRIVTGIRADVGICGYMDQYEGKPSLAPGEINLQESRCLNRLEGLKALLYQMPFDNSMWAKIYRRELFENLWLPEGRLYEDFAVMYRLFGRGENIAYNPWKGYYYLHRADGIMEERFSPKKMDLIDLADEMKQELLPLYPQLRGGIWSRYFRANCHIYLQIPRTPEYDSLRKRVEKNLRESRIEVLKDRESRLGTKGGALCTCLGFPFFYRMKNLKRAGKR